MQSTHRIGLGKQRGRPRETWLQNYLASTRIGIRAADRQQWHQLSLSRWEQKWFISVKGELEKNAIEASRVWGLRAQQHSQNLQ